MPKSTVTVNEYVTTTYLSAVTVYIYTQKVGEDYWLREKINKREMQ